MILLSIIVPVFNEENSIDYLLKKLLKLDLTNVGFKHEIIVINDGSTDKTLEILKNFSQIKLLNQSNMGKGNAVQNGIKHASGEYIIIQDGDLEYEPLDIIKMCVCIKKNSKITVYGSRYKPFYFGILPKYYSGQNFIHKQKIVKIIDKT